MEAVFSKPKYFFYLELAFKITRFVLTSLKQKV